MSLAECKEGERVEFKTGRSNGVTIANYDFAKTGHAITNYHHG